MHTKIVNTKTQRKYERTAGMKFQDILHKGHWGNGALCADYNGDIWWVNKWTGIFYKEDYRKYRNGEFCILPKPKPFPPDGLYEGMSFNEAIEIYNAKRVTSS